MRVAGSAVFGLVAEPPCPSIKAYSKRSAHAGLVIDSEHPPTVVGKGRLFQVGLVALALGLSVSMATAWPVRPVIEARSVEVVPF
jgi:hypothetical protein